MTQTNSLYDKHGKRLYLTPSERKAFFEAAKGQPDNLRTFCHMLYFTGCRVSEALNLTADRVDVPAGEIIIHSLKKRGDTPHYRAVPVPKSFLDDLANIYSITGSNEPEKRLWTWSRSQSWRLIKKVMLEAEIDTKLPHATCKGLRHGYGIQAACKGVPINIIQKLLGHNKISTTALYMDAVGEEKRQLVSRMWDK